MPRKSNNWQLLDCSKPDIPSYFFLLYNIFLYNKLYIDCELRPTIREALLCMYLLRLKVDVCLRWCVEVTISAGSGSVMPRYVRVIVYHD